MWIIERAFTGLQIFHHQCLGSDVWRDWILIKRSALKGEDYVSHEALLASWPSWVDVLRDALSLARYMFSFYSTSLSVSVHPTLCSTFPLDCLFIDVIEYVCAFRNVCVCVCVYIYIYIVCVCVHIYIVCVCVCVSLCLFSWMRMGVCICLSQEEVFVLAKDLLVSQRS